MGRLTILEFIYGQLAKVPPVVTVDLTGKTVMVVGANTGLGFEASKHFARMNPARLVLTARSPSKGRAAVERIKQETGCQSVELGNLDLSRFSSVKEFADKFLKDDGRLDILVQNAAVSPAGYEESSDGWESALQVNNLSQSLLVLLLLPRMIHTSKQYSTTPRIVVVSSEAHFFATLPQSVLESAKILETVGSKEYCTMPGVMRSRYNLTKLLNMCFVLALSERLSSVSTHTPIVNGVNPGYCYSELRRNLGLIVSVFDWMMEKALARTSEEGGRQLVWAAVGGEGNEDETRGAYISACRVEEPSDILLGEEGQKLQNGVWEDMLRILVEVDPRVQEVVDQYLTTPILR
ncbi:short-chain dehydrogenase [Tricholoma matsutake]|nr:short-chain dehydrogenase [Tricholoma matsutake 945]